MSRYYTRVCNFYYGIQSEKLVKRKKSLPLSGNKKVSFDHVEIISRKTKKKFPIYKIKNLSLSLKKKIMQDLKIITSKKKSFANLNFQKLPCVMGILNLTPDSFSDGGKFNTKKKGLQRVLDMHKSGADIIDIGGESTRPGSRAITEKLEWIRIHKILKTACNKVSVSLDTRKSEIMKRGIKYGIKLINDVSGLSYDPKTIEVLKNKQIPFVIQHSQGDPENMQNNPTYKNELLDIYDFFEKKIKFLRSVGIRHNNIIIDPGIGFGKNLKHNMNLISNISIFHSLGFPILVGVSRKKFIKELSEINDTKKRIGGTVASSIYLMMQGVQIIRVHDVDELLQGIKVFKKLIQY